MRGAANIDLRALIRDVPDFPSPGVVFKDITPLLRDHAAFKLVIDIMTKKYRDLAIEVVVGIEARGFIFGAPLAYNLGAAFVPVRKKGKLPAESISAEYALEYGTSAVEIHRDGVLPGKRVLLVDDLLATGGTMSATVDLVERLGGEVEGIAVLVELDFLKGRTKLPGRQITSLIHY